MGSCRIVEKFVIYLRVWWVWIRCGLGVRMHCGVWLVLLRCMVPWT